ncbi:MAG: hypothetical protein K0R05_1891 [Anaerocolumna sp.]|nr:hypothetical protein [Anaerocolumna sp.]
MAQNFFIRSSFVAAVQTYLQYEQVKNEEKHFHSLLILYACKSTLIGDKYEME